MNRRGFIKTGMALPACAVGFHSLGAGALGLDLCAEDRDAAGASDEVRLRSAENPEGPPRSAIEAARRELEMAHRYPRRKITEFREKVAKENGITAENVVVGAGSIELMINTGLYFGKAGRAVLSGDPTWATTVKYAQANGADWVRVPLTSDYHYDFDRMLAAMSDKVDLVYICHPNNPTGVAEDHDRLEAFVKQVAESRVVMIDEAFIDCLEDAESLSMKKLVPEYKNVIVTRTFSKLWGMAGFRVGYMLGDPPLMRRLESTVPTLEMQSSIAAAAAIAAYDDHQYIARGRRDMRVAAETIYRILNAHGLSYIRSDTNFMSFQVNEPGTDFVDKMKKQGVALKPIELGEANNWARVSCGAPGELAAFESALGKVV